MKKIAISGYFDPIHVGHIEYINNAKKLGDWLVVIVNNNNQCALKKGKYFMDEKERVLIVKNIKAVDEVFLSIDEDKTVCKSLKKVNPDVFANGGDRKNYEIPESKVCKENNIQIIDGLGKKIRSSSELTGIGLDKNIVSTPILSLIVPVYNEKDNIANLFDNIENAIKIPISVNIIYDNDSDDTLPVIKDCLLYTSPSPRDS